METGNLIIDAQTAFAKQRRRSRRERVKRLVLGRRPAVALASLDSALGPAPSPHRNTAGPQAIPLASIVGTAEPAKARAFDGGFRPPAASRRRWERLWMASRRGAPLPPISVYRLGDEHFVSDGHHRVSVAHALGMAAIDAEVIDLAA